MTHNQDVDDNPAADIEFEVTQEDIDEARRLGLSGREMLARIIRRKYPDAHRVVISLDGSTITVDSGGPALD